MIIISTFYLAPMTVYADGNGDNSSTNETTDKEGGKDEATTKAVKVVSAEVIPQENKYKTINEKLYTNASITVDVLTEKVNFGKEEDSKVIAVVEISKGNISKTFESAVDGDGKASIGVSFPEDGEYLLSVYAKEEVNDLSGSPVEEIGGCSDNKVCYDTTAPRVQNSYIQNKPFDFPFFGKIYIDSIDLDISDDILGDEANDKIFEGSGPTKVKYRYWDMTKNEFSEFEVEVESDTATIRIPSFMRTIVDIQLEDELGNKSSDWINLGMITIDGEELHGSYDHVTITRNEAPFKDSAGRDLYTSSVSAEIVIEDYESGIDYIKIEVNSNNQDNKTIIEKNLSDDSSGFSIDRDDDGIIVKATRTISISGEDNGIQLKAMMKDNAKNESSNETSFSIDKSSPVVDIIYPEGNNDSTYSDYYNKSRNIEVRVTDANFNSDSVTLINETDGSRTGISGWAYDEGYYSATVPIDKDGEYDLYVQAFDYAAHGTETGKTHFFIDKTKPKVTCSFNDEESQNGFYKKDRELSISVVDDSFISSRVEVVNNNENNKFVSSFMDWNSNGSNNKATIQFNEDGQYGFTIKITDMAGNSSEIAIEDFVVDLTEPSISLYGIEDKASIKGEFSTKVNVTDKYLTNSSVTIKGFRRGFVDLISSVTNIDNGKSYSFNNFPVVQGNDDVYTMTIQGYDNAGNISEKILYFTINRFGSVFDISGLLNINHWYLKQTKDIVFYESNPDYLASDSSRIVLSVNGSVKTLAKNTDYSVELSGSDSEMKKYKYTIFSNNFANDGVYSIMTYSVDAAGNVNENQAKEAEIRFAVDNTGPSLIVTGIEDEGAYITDKLRIDFYAMDNLNLKSLKVLVNGNEVPFNSAGDTNNIVLEPSEEPYSVEIYAYDESGNVTVKQFKNVKVSKKETTENTDNTDEKEDKSDINEKDSEKPAKNDKENISKTDSSSEIKEKETTPVLKSTEITGATTEEDNTEKEGIIKKVITISLIFVGGLVVAGIVIAVSVNTIRTKRR